jgi:nucleotide-binding universal stress UspA family protein
MKQIRNIVVPIDFSGYTEKLFDYAVYIGTSFSAKLHLVHVVDIISGDAMLGMPMAAEFQLQYETGARKRMDALVQELENKSSGSTGQIVSGEPVKEIVKFAESLQADLIVISTHGSKGLESILLGSVARRVVKHAHCPVLVMNPFREKTD